VAAAVAAILTGGTAWSAAANREPPPDPREATTEEVIEYYDSGRFAEDTARVARRARRSLKRQLKRRKGPRKPAIVFDIDDTALSTYKCQKGHGEFGGTELTLCVVEAGSETTLGTGNGLPPIKPVLRLYDLAMSRGVAAFFITGRPDFSGPYSIDNLHAAGFEGPIDLTTQPAVQFLDNTANGKSLVPYKSGHRARIEREGHRILVNIGDQRSDLQGGHAKATFKLPNPMYYTP
jgi:predicted secreted acid phosphatase